MIASQDQDCHKIMLIMKSLPHYSTLLSLKLKSQLFKTDPHLKVQKELFFFSPNQLFLTNSKKKQKGIVTATKKLKSAMSILSFIKNNLSVKVIEKVTNDLSADTISSSIFFEIKKSFIYNFFLTSKKKKYSFDCHLFRTLSTMCS